MRAEWLSALPRFATHGGHETPRTGYSLCRCRSDSRMAASTAVRMAKRYGAHPAWSSTAGFRHHNARDSVACEPNW